jgi:hypothetical protein
LTEELLVFVPDARSARCTLDMSSSLSISSELQPSLSEPPSAPASSNALPLPLSSVVHRGVTCDNCFQRPLRARGSSAGSARTSTSAPAATMSISTTREPAGTTSPTTSSRSRSHARNRSSTRYTAASRAASESWLLKHRSSLSASMSLLLLLLQLWLRLLPLLPLPSLLLLRSGPRVPLRW